MMEHFDALVTDPAVKLADVEAHPAALTGNERFRGRCWVAATSGTTGQRGIFLWAWTRGAIHGSWACGGCSS